MKTKTLLELGNSNSATTTDYETAIKHAGQGKFQYGLMVAIGLFFIACTFETFCISYLLPSAECDLRMTSHEKSILNSSPFVGSLAGACIWGKLADSWGRRSVILMTISIDAIAGILSSFMQSFWPFVLFRFIIGLTSIAAIPVCYPYMGEFYTSDFRSRAVVWVSVFWSIGSILIPLLAWAIIPRPWLLGSAEIGFRFNSWRIFIAASALFSVISAIAIYIFPESPAFLLTKGKQDEALEVFKKIYHWNSGKPPNSYPVTRLEIDNSQESESGSAEGKGDREDEIKTSNLMAMIFQIVDLFRPPLLKNTVIGLISLFSLQLGFFGFAMWFPELFNRFEEFHMAHPNETATLCEVSSMQVETPQWMADWKNGTNATLDCGGDTIQPQVFINTFTISLACIICSLITGAFVKRIGQKRVIGYVNYLSSGAMYSIYLTWVTLLEPFSIFPSSTVLPVLGTRKLFSKGDMYSMGLYFTAMTITSCCVTGSYFVRTSTQNLALACALQASNSASYATITSVIIELYPVTLRGLATTILMNFSNVGSIMGNLLFGLLLDVNCAYPVFISAGVLGGCTVLCFFLPNKKNEAKS